MTLFVDTLLFVLLYLFWIWSFFFGSDDEMKIAIAGKGGVGKTTIAGTLARMLADDGRKVMAIDADPDANLASALGCRPEVAREIIRRAIEIIPSKKVRKRKGKK